MPVNIIVFLLVNKKREKYFTWFLNVKSFLNAFVLYVGECSFPAADICSM